MSPVIYKEQNLKYQTKASALPMLLLYPAYEL